MFLVEKRWEEMLETSIKDKCWDKCYGNVK